MDQREAVALLMNRQKCPDDISAEWNRLREAGVQPPSLAGAELSRVDLCGINLRGVNLHSANLSESNLSGANLSGADLSKANLRAAVMGYADLRRVNLRQACLLEADFYHGTIMCDADLRGTDLRGTRMWGTYMRGTDLRDADLSPASCRGCAICSQLEFVNLRDAQLQRASLREAYLYMANLRGANLYLADLGRANLAMADLRGADLSRANLRGTDLRGTSLTPELLRGRALFDDSSKFGDCDLKNRSLFPRHACSILFLLDTGSATAEEIAELFGLISDFNRALGGYGFRFEHGPHILTEATPIRTTHQMEPLTEDVSAAEAETAALAFLTSERTGTRSGRRFRFERRSVSAILATFMSGPDGQPTRVDRVARAATVMACHRVLEDRRAFNGKTKTLAGGPVEDRDSRLQIALDIVSKQQLSTSRAQWMYSLSDSIGAIRWMSMPIGLRLLSQLLDNELFEDHPVIADGLERLGCFYRNLADTRQVRLTCDIRWSR